MLAFERHSRGETDRAELAAKALIVAGWTGRDEKALHHHIEELAAIGVPRPLSMPVFYRISRQISRKLRTWRFSGPIHQARRSR